jgi:hypothetical protein
MSPLGQTRKSSRRGNVFRFAPKTGHAAAIRLTSSFLNGVRTALPRKGVIAPRIFADGIFSRNVFRAPLDCSLVASRMTKAP